MRIAHSHISTKTKQIAACTLLALFIICARLIQLQIHLMDFFVTKGERNFQRLEKKMAPRGNILDCKGRILVTNRPVTHLYWQGSGQKPFDTAVTPLLTTLKTILGDALLVDEQLIDTLKHAERRYKKVPLVFDLSFEQLSQLEEQFPNHASLRLETNFERFYPHKHFASHVLGYLGRLNVETVGKMGLEQLFDDELRGHPGTTLKTINSFGRNLAEVELEKGLSGQALQTTLDIDLQQIAESIFPKGQSGTIILMDPYTGALQALVSRPDFDPTIFLKPIEQTQWQELQNAKPFLNRAFRACYPPGSIFKLVTTSAALENNIITQDTHINCKGYVTCGIRKSYCHLRSGHGELTACQALAQSCNVLFYDIGKKIDIDCLANYATMFGLGQSTNVIFSEKTGLVPTRAWKQETKGERWWRGETLSTCIGQSYLLVTPIQAARMIASIFTGYLVNPRILVNEPIVKTPLNIKPSTLSFLQQSMRSVVTTGTGRQVGYVKNLSIFAKTSTAQTSAFEKREMGNPYLEHGWLVAHFNYKQLPPHTLVVFAENVGSSRVAASIAKDFLIAYKEYVDNRAPRPDCGKN